MGIRFSDKDAKAVLIPTTDEFRQAWETARKWYQAGYYPDEALPAVDANAAFKAGEYAGYLHLFKPGGTAELKAKYGFDFVSKSLAQGYLTTAGVVASLTGIPKTS